MILLRHIRWLVAVCLTVAPGPALAASIGVFFDTAATNNCKPDIVEFPAILDVYIVISDLAPGTMLYGWECELSSDANIVLNMAEFAGTAIHLMPFPKLVVGISPPLETSTATVVGRLAAFASGPGGIYISGAGISDNQGRPVALTGLGSGGLLPLDLEYGGEYAPAATVGNVECPVPRWGDSGALALMGEVGPGATHTLTFHIDYAHDYAKDDAPGALPAATDVWFEGTVLEVELVCVENLRQLDGTLPALSYCRDGCGAARLLMSVNTVLAGVVEDTVEVYVIGYDVAGCCEYSGFFSLPRLEDVVVGSTCFVAADRIENGLLDMYGSLVVVGAAKGRDANLLRNARALSRAIAVDHQERDAAVVLDGVVRGIARNAVLLDVRRVVRGRGFVRGQLFVRIDREGEDGSARYGKYPVPGLAYRVFADVGADGNLTLSQGLQSLVLLAGGRN